MKTKRMELAKAGVFGEDGTEVTAEHLAEITQTFSGRVPCTLGHSLADWMPALGFVTAVSFDPKTTLFVGEKVELSDVLDDAMEQRFFGNWSIGVRKRKSDGKRYFHHLAMLGAVPPKIKDLKVLPETSVVNMADDADTEERWTFKLSDTNDSKWGVIGQVLGKIRDYFVADKGVDEADKIINAWEIDYLKRPEEDDADVYAADAGGDEKPPALSGLDIVDGTWDEAAAAKRVFGKYGIAGLEAYSLYCDPEGKPENKSTYKFLVVDIVDGKPAILAKALSTSLAYCNGARDIKIADKVKEVVEPKVKKLLEKNTKEKQNMADEERMKQLEASVRASKKEALQAAVKGKVPADKMTLVLELADSLPVDESIELSDSDGKKRKTSALDLLREIFAAIPLPVAAGETNMGDPAGGNTAQIDPRKFIQKM